MLARPLIDFLIAHYGWRLADAVADCALLLALCSVAVKAPPLGQPPARESPRDVVYLFPFVMFFCLVGSRDHRAVCAILYFPIIRNEGCLELAASALISLSEGVRILERAGIGRLSDRFGRLFKISVFLKGILCLFLQAGDGQLIQIEQ